MVYEKCFDGLFSSDDEDEAILIGNESRKRSKKPMLFPRSVDSTSSAPKAKKNKFSSELSMSPITLSSDTDDNQDDDVSKLCSLVN